MTRDELKAALKTAKAEGKTTISLASKTVELQAEYDRLFNTVDPEDLEPPTWEELKAVATKIAAHMEDLASKPVEEVLEIRRKVLQDAGVGQREIEDEINSLRDRLEVEPEDLEEKHIEENPDLKGVDYTALIEKFAELIETPEVEKPVAVLRAWIAWELYTRDSYRWEAHMYWWGRVEANQVQTKAADRLVKQFFQIPAKVA